MEARTSIDAEDEWTREYLDWGDEGIVIRYADRLMVALDVESTGMRVCVPVYARSLLADLLERGLGDTIRSAEMTAREVAEHFDPARPWQGRPAAMRVDRIGPHQILRVDPAWVEHDFQLGYPNLAERLDHEPPLGTIVVPPAVASQLVADLRHVDAGRPADQLWVGGAPTRATPLPSTLAAGMFAPRRI